MQQPDERWSVEGVSAAHVAAYFPEDEGITDADVKNYRGNFESALTEASVEARNEDARRYLDSYSCEGSLEVAKDNGESSTKVNVTAIGGDFFFVHPLELLSGNYIKEQDLMDDEVVLDEYTAWLLYGGTDISGQYIMINDKLFYIAGVVKPHDSGASKKTYGIRSRIFMSYSAYKSFEENAKITCYEIVFPDMITNYAYNEMKKVLGQDTPEESVSEEIKNDDSAIEVVNLTTRFGYRNLWKVLTSYGERSSAINGIVYPFWENECRRVEDFGVLVLLWNIIFGVIAIIEIIPDAIKLYKFLLGKAKIEIGKLHKKYGFK